MITSEILARFYSDSLDLSFPIAREKYPQGDELRWRPCVHVVSCAHITANHDLPRYTAILSPSVQRRTRLRIAGRRLYGAKQARKLLPPKHEYVIDENCHTWVSCWRFQIAQFRQRCEETRDRVRYTRWA